MNFRQFDLENKGKEHEGFGYRSMTLSHLSTCRRIPKRDASKCIHCDAIAKQHFEDGLIVFKGIGNLNFQMVLKSELGHIERRTGNSTQARLIYQDTLKGWQEMGNRSAIANQLECFGFLAIADEEPQRTIKLFSAAEALREKIESPMNDYERVEYDRSVARLRSMLAEAEFNTIWGEGRSMTMEQAIEYALATDASRSGCNG